MKKLLLLPLMFACYNLLAQGTVQNSTAFSIGGEIGVPNYGLYNVAFAASAKFEVPVVSPVSVSFTGGLTTLFQRSSIIDDYNGGTDLFAPLKAGLKYYFVQNVYLEGEGGVALELNHARNSLGLFSIGPGFVIPSEKGGLDISFRYEDWQGQLKQTAIRVAYRFGL